MNSPAVVGRLMAPEALPGGVATIFKACRKAGGWYVWATVGRITKPVKTVAAAESGTGSAVYEDRPFLRVLAKGLHDDGRRFVAEYVRDSKGAWKAESAYVWTTEHEAKAPGYLDSTIVANATESAGTVHRWTSPRPAFRRVSSTHLKGYIA